MSGHSKWHNIQAKKGKADKARSNIFTKMSRMISVVAQQGGGDPMMNFSLRLAIDKAKAVNMPKIILIEQLSVELVRIAKERFIKNCCMKVLDQME